MPARARWRLTWLAAALLLLVAAIAPASAARAAAGPAGHQEPSAGAVPDPSSVEYVVHPFAAERPAGDRHAQRPAVDAAVPVAEPGETVHRGTVARPAAFVGATTPISESSARAPPTSRLPISS